MRLRFFGLVAAAVLVATACGTAASPSPAATAAPSAAPTAAASSAAPSAAPTSAASASASAAPSAAASESAAASASAPASGGASTGTLTVSRFADWYNFFHPVEFQTGDQFQWWSCIFNTLVNVDADSTTITPGLADTWEASADATTYTFHLHPGIKWQDGTPFTAQDVIYSATWFAQNADAYKGFIPVWGQVKGAADIKGKPTGTLTGITAPDDNTVVITLATPNSIFLQQMTDMANVIIPQHVLKDVTAADVEKVPFTTGTPGTTIGTGPYTLTSFTPDQSVELTANPDYFRGAPKINKIVFKLFADSALGIAQLQSGDLQLAFRVPPTEFETLKAINTLSVESDPNPGIVRIVFDTTKAPWDKKEVRQAFYYAINRAAIVENVFQGRAHVLYNPPGLKVYDDLNKYDYNVDTAKQLLQTGGYTGQTFRLLYNQTFPSANAIMPLIQSDLEAAGVKVQLIPTDNATYLTDYNDRTTWDGFIAVGGSEALSPQKSKQYFKPADQGGDKFESGYTNPQIFTDWATALASTDATVQDNSYHDLAKILNTDVPQINLYADDLVQAYTTKLGGGFKVHLNERETFMNVETWTLSQ